MTSTEVLAKFFGYDSFRSYQQEAVNAAVSGRDALVVMPTGGGKSVCYQVPAMMLEGLTVVVSPLIALMKDQVDALRANGISAAFLNSGLSTSEQNTVIQQARRGDLKLLYLAPERLSARDFTFMQVLKELNVRLFAVDEAHCISHWGPDFRPDYLILDKLKEYFPQVPIMALTASADALTRQDIIQKLRLQHPDVFLASFNRPNLAWHVRPKKNARESLLQYLQGRKEESGIIYCLSRSAVEALAALLKDRGFSADFYHAGLSSEDRSRVQEAFSKDKVRIIVATIAFGMGIDKSNVRFVIHMDLPKNVESYYQETGRAGRDGLPSEAILYYSAGDVFKLRNMISKDAEPEQRDIMLKKLDQMSELAEARQCRRQYLMHYFGEQHPDHCGNCDYCLSDIERYDGSIDAQKVLSAVVRLKERFGTGIVIDFLRGSQSQRITQEMRDLKTYGIGKDKTVEEWQFIIKQMLQRNLLELAEGTYPTLKTNEFSREVLSGQRSVLLEAYKKPATSTYAQESLPAYHEGLFAHLKQVRLQIADEQGVPAYVVVSDATLVELARYRPFQKEELFNIGGFGQFKVDKYGDQFVDAIKKYCASEKLESLMSEKVLSKPKAKEAAIFSPTAEVSLKMFRAGKSTAQIAVERNFTEGTIINHLVPYVESGDLKANELISNDKMSRIERAIEEHGTQVGLKVLKEALEEDISYSDIRVAIAAAKASVDA
jgi:ATP-dependent DNA helicase RecQ